ncbi:MAG TPA: 4-vinyl reductase [archaeon]|nr:4-vinyl reductase [archaeon]
MVFDDFFKKLLISRELKMEEGKLTILNESWTMLPTKIYVGLVREFIKNPKLSYKLYYLAKEANRTGMANTMKKKYGLDKSKFINTGIDMANMAGWGNIKIVNLDMETGNATCNMYNSPVAAQFGHNDKPVDHIWRGVMAAGLSVALDKEIDWVEVSCIAQGKPFCTFISKPRVDWLKDKNPLVREQLGLDKIQAKKKSK